jgi:hypothetical protein
MMEKDQEIWYTSVGQSARQTGICEGEHDAGNT